MRNTVFGRSQLASVSLPSRLHDVRPRFAIDPAGVHYELGTLGDPDVVDVRVLGANEDNVRGVQVLVREGHGFQDWQNRM